MLNYNLNRITNRLPFSPHSQHLDRWKNLHKASVDPGFSAASRIRVRILGLDESRAAQHPSVLQPLSASHLLLSHPSPCTIPPGSRCRESRCAIRRALTTAQVHDGYSPQQEKKVRGGLSLMSRRGFFVFFLFFLFLGVSSQDGCGRPDL